MNHWTLPAAPDAIAECCDNTVTANGWQSSPNDVWYLKQAYYAQQPPQSQQYAFRLPSAFRALLTFASALPPPACAAVSMSTTAYSQQQSINSGQTRQQCPHQKPDEALCSSQLTKQRPC